MSEWKLSDLCVGKGSYGIGAPAVDYNENLPTYLRITDINDDGTLNHNGFKSVDNAESYKYTLKKNDIVFARTGNSTGRSYFYNPADGEFVYAGFLIKFSLDPVKVNPRIIKYYTHSQPYYDWVKSFDTGATRGNINAQTFADMPIELPDRNIQDRIVSILSSLDAKIENNNKVNAKLEEIAQNLFKEWFVDFSPFMNGKFVESELGLIPEGWRVGTLGEIIINTIAGDWGKDNEEGNFTFKVACIRGADIEDVKAGNKGKMPTRYILPKNFNAKHLEANDLVVEISGGSPTQSTGRICLISDSLLNRYDNALVCTNFCRALKPIPEYSMFLYNIWQNLYDKGVMFLYENGTTGIKNLALNDLIAKQLVILPPKEITLKFNNLVASFEMVIQQNGIENEKLATIRDTLLPKLMSGEIEV